jgi:hypothetical protein
MEAARTSKTSVVNYFTRQYIPEDNSELHTRRRENLKSHRSHKPYSFKKSKKALRVVGLRHADAKRNKRYSSYSFLTSALDGVSG